MAIEKTLCAQKREGTGKCAAHRLRNQDLVPGVFYNRNGENINVQVPHLPLEQLYFAIGNNTVFNLEIDDNGTKTTYPVLFWDVQKHAYKKRFTHIDYYGVDLEREISIKVPVVYEGVAKGTKIGGELATYVDQIVVSAKPLDIPHRVVVDVTDLNINDTITVADLKLGEGVRAIYDRPFKMVAVQTKGADEEEEAAEGAAAPAAAAK